MRGATFVLLASMVANVMFAAGRVVVPLRDGWTFCGADSVQRAVSLPHDFQISQPWVEPGQSERADLSDAAANRRSRLSARGFKEMGTGTYVLRYTPDTALQDSRLTLDFGGIMLTGDVYVNGHRVGGTDYGYVGFETDVTGILVPGTENEIKVVAQTGDAGVSRWYTGGGLIRGVDLVSTPRDLYMDRHPVYVQVSDISADEATVTVTADINARKPHSEFRAVVSISAPDGATVCADTVDVQVNPKWRHRPYDLHTVKVASPEMWSCETPSLYIAKVTLLRADGSVADSYEQTFGIRTIEFDPQHGFRLNGRKVLLKGIANHSEYGPLGAAAYPRAIEKRILMLKEFGFNHIRTSHNPYSPEFYDLCDRYGIIVVDELYDKWLDRYAGGRVPWTSLWQHDIPEWVRAHRNHPSVVMWSLGNELQGYSDLPYNDWGVTAYRVQKTLLDKYDTSRPVTVAMHPRYRSVEGDSLPAPLALETDVASYNYRYMYFPGDAARYPWMVFYQSEASLSDMGPNYYVPDSAKVVGLAYWGMIDYLGESQGWPAKGWSNGVFDISLEPKPRAWMLRGMFSDAPVVHIGVEGSRHTVVWNGVEMSLDEEHDYWNLAAGDTVKIYAYTNADRVDLRLNGKSLGCKSNDKTDPTRRGRVEWDRVPYSPGRLEAVAYNGDTEVARHCIRTAGRPVRLVAETDNDSWTADGIDLQHIRVYAVDKHGVRCPQASDTLHFSLSGDAVLVAVANGDIASEESYTGDSRRLWHGGAQAILRAGNTAGEVVLTIQAEGFRPIQVKLRTSPKV